MKTFEIKKSEFIEDWKTMTVESIKEKYGLNNGSFYKITKSLGLSKCDYLNHKKIKLVD